MVLRLGIGPELLQLECRVQTAELTENLRPQGILIGVSSPGGPHLSTKHGSTQLPANSSAVHFRPNNQQERNTAPPIRKNIRQQKNMLQMKKQGKNLQDKIIEEEIDTLPEKEFRVMIVKMIQNLRNRMEAKMEKIREILTGT